MQKTTTSEIRDITTNTLAGMSDHDRDEMAIPSYLHGNPLIRWLMWRRYEVIAHYLDDVDGNTALEFGCGLGLFLPELNARFDRVFACDLFPDYARALSERRKLNTRFVPNVGAVPDASLDVLIAADVLEHIRDLPVYLTEFALKLKPGGRLIISGPTENHLYRLGRTIAGFGGKGDYHHTNIDRLIADITQQGFIPLRTRRLPFRCAPALFKIAEFANATRSGLKNR
jgi:SAM-dependent methyltransferase